MARFNLRGVTRNVSFIMHNRKPNYKAIVGSFFVTGIYKNTMIKKRPRWANWLAGKNKF